MERLAQFIFSMRMMVVALFVFLVSIALATFVETIYDTQTAKILVYNASWFMILLAYLCVGLIANIFRYQMFQREKIAILSFHLAFIIMIIGAAVTRFFGFEGQMMIREGQSVNYIYSADPYLSIKVNDGKMQYTADYKTYLSEFTNNYFEHAIDFPKHEGLTVEYAGFLKNQVDSLVVHDSIKEMSLGIVTNGMEPTYLSEGNFMPLGSMAISFEKNDGFPGVQLWKQGNNIRMKSMSAIRALSMTQLQAVNRSGGEVPDSMYLMIPADSVVNLQMATLYNVDGQQFVLKEIKKHAKMMLIPSSEKGAGTDYLKVRVKDGKHQKVVLLAGGMGKLQTQERFMLNGLAFQLGYGSRTIELPFYIRCDDFLLKRYPGSQDPASYKSDITVIDSNGISKEKNYESKREIFMNHVTDYGGYRFFQSSYDQDEKGTILSVNHDWWGTNISYLGYLLMGIGMIVSLFARNGRVNELFRMIEKTSSKRTLSVLFALAVSTSFYAGAQEKVSKRLPDTLAQEVGVAAPDSLAHPDAGDHAGHDHAAAEQAPMQADPKLYIMTAEQSEELATLLVQDQHGRFIPMHTLCDQLLRKVYHGTTYKEYNAVQTVMSMHMYRDYWINQKIIYVSSRGELRELLHVGKYASVMDLVDVRTGDFKLTKEYNEAFRKREVLRNERDKQLIKLGERFQVLMSVFSQDWHFIRILPVEGDSGNKWTGIIEQGTEVKGFPLAIAYFATLDKACRGTGTYEEATKNLNALKAYQRQIGKDALPSETQVKMEVMYNKLAIFASVQYYYLLFGFFLIVLFVIQILRGKETRSLRITRKIFHWVLFAGFACHAAGITMRWIISGHAPWSDGYEAMVFIAWVAMVFGVIFSRKNSIVLAGAAMFAFFLLFVSELNLMDPDITPLSPVLQSYWLKIHVAIITGSYAPLGIAAILALINLIIFLVRPLRGGKELTSHIKELSYFTEILITIGVMMLTIGTFLGGVWANESWGRYWGWDPKETWALVAVLAYAVILHLRYIPGMKDKFTFNAVSFWGFATILFTFFGVNFYLVGLHSYANGEGMAEFPEWLGWFIGIMYVFTEFASLRNQLHLSGGAKVPMKHYTKKLIILYAIILGVGLMCGVFHIADWGNIAIETGKILLIVFGANLVTFVLGNVLRKEETKTQIEEL